jgi:peroxiredoxin
MKKAIFFLLVITIGLTAASMQATKLKVGDKAPDFALPNGDGKLVRLSDYIARGPVVLVFYRGFW